MLGWDGPADRDTGKRASTAGPARTIGQRQESSIGILIDADLPATRRKREDQASTPRAFTWLLGPAKA
jgi:hypothetical protein